MQDSVIPDRQPSSAQELVEYIAKCARSSFERTGRGINGAILAGLIREEYPGLDYVRLGLSKLGDAVRLGTDMQLIRRNPTVKHLEVLPIQPDMFPEPVIRRPPSDSFVTQDLWKAAVLAPAGSRNFINKLTGQIVSGTDSTIDLGKQGPDSSLVEIAPISESMQIQWLREFLLSKGRLVNDGDEYFRTLLRRANELGPLARDWKFFRSRKAVEHIREWATRHKIPESLVLVPPNRDLKRRATVHQHDDAASARQAALAAIADMPLDELEKLAVPLRYIFKYFTVK